MLNQKISSVKTSHFEEREREREGETETERQRETDRERGERKHSVGETKYDVTQTFLSRRNHFAA